MSTVFNSEMLALARESRALTQSEVARRTGLSQPYLSKLERGEDRHPSKDAVESLARVLGYPTSFFYVAERRTGIGLSFIMFRKRASTAVSSVRQLQALVNLRRFQVSRLLAEIEVESARSIERMEITEFESPERVAQLVRATWQLPIGPIANLVEIVEAAGGVVFQERLGLPEVDGVSHWADDSPPIFLMNSQVPADRSRWSLAHELGHVVMHRVPTNDLEGEADRFAAEFLMPESEIAADLKNLTLQRAAQLKLYWRVSMQALIRRAKDVGSISPGAYQKLMITLSSLGYRKHEPGEIAGEQPSTVHRIIDVLIKSGFSSRDFAGLVQLTEEEFASTFLPQPHLRLQRPASSDAGL